MRLKLLLTLVFLFTILSSQVFAGDAAKLSIIGFSPDGKYMAYEIFGVQDGSGFGYSTIYFLNVPKNSYAAKAIAQGCDLKKEGEKACINISAIRKKALNKANTTIRRFNIRSELKGITLVHQPYTDLDIPIKKLKEVRFTLEPMIPGWSYNAYTVNLETRVAKKQSYCYDLAKAEILKLSISGKKLKQPIVLQEDKRLPKSRGCAYQYRIYSIINYKFTEQDKKHSFLVVFVSYLKAPGFEGPDSRFMAISGILL